MRELLLDINLDTGLAFLVHNLEREVLDITLDVLVHEFASDQTFDIVDSTFRVCSKLIFGCE